MNYDWTLIVDFSHKDKHGSSLACVARRNGHVARAIAIRVNMREYSTIMEMEAICFALEDLRRTIGNKSFESSVLILTDCITAVDFITRKRVRGKNSAVYHAISVRFDGVSGLFTRVDLECVHRSKTHEAHILARRKILQTPELKARVEDMCRDHNSRQMLSDRRSIDDKWAEMLGLN